MRFLRTSTFSETNATMLSPQLWVSDTWEARSITREFLCYLLNSMVYRFSSLNVTRSMFHLFYQRWLQLAS